MTERVTAVSVIVPTYHRPEMLRAAVASALRQDLPKGLRLEVVVALSDPQYKADRETAEELARADTRLVVTRSTGTGPGAARNAGIAASRGEYLAFLDDDCEAQPGWIRAGVARLAEFDLVQGKTWPGQETTHRYDKSLWIDHLTGWWECCNLFVRRSAVERAGGFDEAWFPTRNLEQPFGEDTEWGWRLVRYGAKYVFEPEALVHHAVFSRSFGEWLEYEVKVSHVPLVAREIPEFRHRLTMGYFLNRRHIFLSTGAGLLLAAAAARLSGRRRLASGLAISAAVPVFSPWRFKPYHAFHYTLKEMIEFVSLVYGSIRYRRPVL